MIFKIPPIEIEALLTRQLNNLFGLNGAEQELLGRTMAVALERCERCFSQNTNKYYFSGGEAYFNPFHSVQYMTFLYYLSNTLYKTEAQGSILCDKIYYLNKSLNGLDLFYTVELPDFFMAEHPVGTVIGGNGKIGDGFTFYQGCTLGGYMAPDGGIIYPELGDNVRLYTNSSIIGRCQIGSNVGIGAGAIVKNEDIPSNVNVFGQSPNLIIKPKKQHND